MLRANARKFCRWDSNVRSAPIHRGKAAPINRGTTNPKRDVLGCNERLGFSVVGISGRGPISTESTQHLVEVCRHADFVFKEVMQPEVVAAVSDIQKRQ